MNLISPNKKWQNGNVNIHPESFDNIHLTEFKIGIYKVRDTLNWNYNDEIKGDANTVLWAITSALIS